MQAFAREPYRWVCNVLCAFGDESSDATLGRVFSVGGVFGMQADWDAFTPKWRERTGGIAFHAADCESDHGDFKGRPHRENQKLYANVTKLLAGESNLMGFGVAVDLTAYNRIFPGVLKDQPYYLCFADVVREFAQDAYLSIPQETVKFTFDRHLEREYNAAYLYDYMVHQEEWRFHAYLEGEISFARRQDSVGVQVADLVARETMKHLDNQLGPQRRLPRTSIRMLASSQRFRFHFYVQKSLEDLKAKAAELDKENRISFRAWLRKYKLQDNFETRMRFLKFLDSCSEDSAIDSSILKRRATV